MKSERYKLSNVSAFEYEDLTENCGIVLYNALNVPPHLFFWLGEHTYTLTVKGSKLNGTLQNLIAKIERSSIKSLFIALPIHFSEIGDKDVLNCFSEYPCVSSKGVTCLEPIKKIFSEYSGSDFSSCQTIFDLLDLFFEELMLPQVYHLNLDTYLQNDAIELERYQLSQVLSSIKALEENADTAKVTG